MTNIANHKQLKAIYRNRYKFCDGFLFKSFRGNSNMIIFVEMATKALFNTVVNWFIRQRIDQIQNFMDHPIETQNGILFSQLFHAEDTEYGKRYGFNTISSYPGF